MGPKEIAEIINSIASLLWPIFAFTVFFAYRKELPELLKRVKRGKFFGQELELREDLDKLQETAIAARDSVPIGDASAKSDLSDSSKIENAIGSASSPKIALILLATEIEREVRKLLAITGWFNRHQYRSLPRALEFLEKQSLLPSSVVSSVSGFWNVRSKLVHGHNIADEDITRAIDSGMTILNALRAIPHEKNLFLREWTCSQILNARC